MNTVRRTCSTFDRAMRSFGAFGAFGAYLMPCRSRSRSRSRSRTREGRLVGNRAIGHYLWQCSMYGTTAQQVGRFRSRACERFLGGQLCGCAVVRLCCVVLMLPHRVYCDACPIQCSCTRSTRVCCGCCCRLDRSSRAPESVPVP